MRFTVTLDEEEMQMITDLLDGALKNNGLSGLGPAVRLHNAFAAATPVVEEVADEDVQALEDET